MVVSGARENKPHLIRESFDPVFEMFTTLGVFILRSTDGGFEILADAYDFNASKSQKKSSNGLVFTGRHTTPRYYVTSLIGLTFLVFLLTK